jgi:hypothetical protein
MSRYNTLCNLELLTDSENLAKNAAPFDEWIRTRDTAFRKRHLIPELPNYNFDCFENFSAARAELISAALKTLNESWQAGLDTAPVEVMDDDLDEEGDDDTDDMPGPTKVGRDYTKFEVQINGVMHSGLPKRKAVLAVVKHLCDQGVTPEEIAELVPWRRNMFCRVDGIVSSSQFVTHRQATVDSGGKRRFFCDDGDLINSAGRTYAVTNGWGNRMFQAIKNILAKFPDKGVKCEKHPR